MYLFWSIAGTNWSCELIYPNICKFLWISFKKLKVRFGFYNLLFFLTSYKNLVVKIFANLWWPWLGHDIFCALSKKADIIFFYIRLVLWIQFEFIKLVYCNMWYVYWISNTNKTHDASLNFVGLHEPINWDGFVQLNLILF